MGEKTSEQSSVFTALECAGFSVRGVVKQPTRRKRQQREREQKRAKKKRGAMLHVMKRSANVTPLAQLPVSVKNSPRVTRSAIFSREFLGALKSAKGSKNKQTRGQQKQRDHARLTTALQSALNKASTSPVLLDTPEPVHEKSVKQAKKQVSSQAENEAEIRSAMRELFSEGSPSINQAEPQGGFFQRLLNLKIEFSGYPFGRREQQNKRSDMLQALKEQHQRGTS